MKRTIAAWLSALIFGGGPGLVAQTTTTFSTTAPGMPTQPPGQPGQPANPNAPAAPGTSTLRGHVFAADSGQPLRKAQVRIMSGELRENRLATTDAEGRYEFKEVRAGRYTISASKGSYVGLSYGQQRPTDAPKPLEILDNQTVERVDFTLPRGGVITGRILDEFGEPMSDVGRGAAVSDRPGPAPARADRPAGVDQRHRRVPAVRHSARPVLPDRDVALHEPDEQRGQDRVRADVFSRHRQPGAGAAHHARRRPGAERHRHGAEADARDPRERDRRHVGRPPDGRLRSW